MTKLCKDADGNEISVGDFVCFKNGIEQYGKAVAMKSGMLELSVFDCDTGDRYPVMVDPRRAWKE